MITKKQLFVYSWIVGLGLYLGVYYGSLVKAIFDAILSGITGSGVTYG